MMYYEEEQEQHEEVQAKLQAEAMEIDEHDAPYLDLWDDREQKAMPSSRTKSSSTPEPSIQNSSSK